MSPSIATRLCIGTSLLAALSACYVVPIDHRTGQPYPIAQAPNVTIVQPPVSAVAAAAPVPSLLQARLYPLNEQAQAAGLLMASVTDQHSGRGTISLSYRGQLMQGDATRVDGSHPGFGRIHAQVLGNGNPSYGGRRGIANAYGNGVSAQCEYVITGPTIGTGACLFTDGAKYQMHFGQ